ncbi:uncharacterized protein LAESUDRAFT_654560 [Laetiporus sulphureus 93-53]|uniref:DUF1740-domain-containing protein n=1 Tax=Laetiporus sulphureus 93-53 TaxID=1314785 RepID=A0A165DYM1_9APHY|nr:uncharacterized protein LAESUDRAFT_654560 [Laetiporus sulphureus 93-53]KZT05893.1 hypothetical protein LAESUDRAFT_654560 [Laetiporus sulphureus 93-53]
MPTSFFSSFPPSFSSFPELEPGPSKRASTPTEDRRGSKKRSKRKEKGDKEGKEHRHRYDREESDEEKDGASRSKILADERGYRERDDERTKAEEDISMRRETTFETTRPVSPRLVYYTDRKGDPLNIQYGGLHAYSIPKYHLTDRGKVILGLDPAWRVVRRGHKGVEIALGGRRKMSSLTDASTRHMLNAVPTRRLLPSAEDKYKYDEVEGFLRLRSLHRHENDQSYRKITASKHDVDSDASASSEAEDSETPEDNSDTIPMTSLQATLKSLEEKIAADPSSISAWLSLLSHTLSTTSMTSKNASKARSEIAVSVLSRALSAHPSNASFKTLRLRYLKAGEEIWHESKLRSEWEEALKIGGTEIWMEWLNWKIRRCTKGTDQIVNDARRALHSIGEDEIGKLRILWRAAVGFRDAGFAERANAIIQAQAELLYQLPPHLVDQRFDNQLDALEDFWESEAPRIGETDAKGSANWSQRSSVTPTARKQVVHSIDDVDPYRRWATSEIVSDRSHQLPTRSHEEYANEDPYATILFSDIRPLLVSIRTSNARHAFRMMWLAFAGLHTPGFLPTLSASGENADDRWACSHFASPICLAGILPTDRISTAGRITADAQAGVLIGREREYASAFGPIKEWGYEVLGPLESLGSRNWRMWGPEDVEDVDKELVREIFAQCRLTDDAEWDILSLAFEAACALKDAISTSKKLLASAQGSLPLWAAHARLQRLRGRVDDARKVYQTVLSASRSSATGERQLWWDWAEMEWLTDRSNAAVEVIVQSTGNQGIGGISLLRAKRYLQEAATQVPAAYWKEREMWIKTLALLELLTTSAHAALSVLDMHLGGLQLGEASHESLTVASLMLLYNHGSILRNPLPPALLRERAETAMEQYPSNMIILGMFLEAEKGQGVWGRVRAMLGESPLDGEKEKSLARRIAEVWVAGWDKNRWEAEQERTRNGLSAAVQSERTRGSAILWRLYVEFEIKAGQLQRAKKLLFRAVGECPLNKELYLLAFGSLRSVFKSGELNDWAETMVERGIRMRKGLDEMLEGWVEDKDINKEGVDEIIMEDEIEHNARELRRLMPY